MNLVQTELKQVFEAVNEKEENSRELFKNNKNLDIVPTVKAGQWYSM